MNMPPKLLPALGFLTTLGLFFSPIVEVQVTGQIPRQLTIYGTFISGDTQSLKGVLMAQNLQFYTLILLLLSWIGAFFSSAKGRLVALSFSVFIISMIPAWMMVYVEDIIKHQIKGVLDHHYAYGIVFAVAGLFCATFSIVGTKQARQQPSVQLLDQDL